MKEIVIDERAVIERHLGYKPFAYATVEDEILAEFDKERRLVGKIIKFDGYIVHCSKKIQNKKTYKKLKGKCTTIINRITLPKDVK